MAINLDKLPDAPWFVNYSEVVDDNSNGTAGLAIGPCEDDCADTFIFSENFSAANRPDDMDEAAFDFICMARNAFAIQMERGWFASKHIGGWKLHNDGRGGGGKFWDWCEANPSPDPVSAILAADAWYKANIEAKKS